MSARQRKLTVASSALLILSIAIAAWAYFSAVGTGAGDASTTTIADPVVTASSPSNGDAHVSWTAVHGPANTPSENAEVTYLVHRSTSAAGPWVATTPTCAGTLPSTTLSCDDFPTTGGTYYYRVTASFRSWTSTGVSNSVIIVTDNAAPTAAITFPADATTYKASTYNAGCAPAGICGTAADATGVASVNLSIKKNSNNTYWNGSIFTGTTETFNPATALGTSGGTSTTWRYTFALPADGSYTIHVQAADTLGNAQTGSTYATTSIFTIDTTAPVTTIAVSPPSPNGSNGWYKTAAPTFTLSATDTGGSGVASTFYKIDAGSTQTYISAVTIPEGQHTISYWSTDTVGNIETTNTTSTIKVDTVNPVTTIALSPASPNGSNGWYKTTAPTFTISATDASGSGVASTSYQIDGGSTQAYSSAVTIPQGQHTIAYWSTDTAGNVEGTHTTSTIKVDSVNPATTITLSPNNPNGSNGWYKTTAPTFTLSATDASSGVASTFYNVDGGSTQTYSSAVTIPEGQHTISYWSTDTAGNLETTHTTATIKVDTVAPTLSLVTTSPSTGIYGAGLSGATVLFQACNTNATYGFRFVGSVTDGTSGAASVNYPVLSATKWTTHNDETVSTPAIGPYTSSDFLWSPNNCTGGIAATPGSYTVTASDAAGNTTATVLSFTDDHSAPTVTNVTLNNNGGTPGTMDLNDFVEVTYSELMDASSICSTWANGSVQTTSTGVTITVSTADVMSVTASGCTTFHFGAVSLVGNYNSATGTNNRTFSGSLSWDPSTKKLKITVTSNGSGGTAGSVASNTTPTYANSGATREADIAQNMIGTGTFTGTSSKF